MKQLIYTLFAALLIACTPASSFAQNAKNINVSISEKNGLKKITIKKTLADGTIDVTNWEGTGPIPEEIKKEMEKGGAFSIQTGKGDFKFFSDDSVHVDGGPHKIMFISDKDVNGKLEKEIEVIVEQSKEGNNIEEIQNVKVIRFDSSKWNERSNLEKELKIIVEQAKGDKSFDGAQKIKVIQIDGENEFELKEDDVDIQIHKIEDGSKENVVELIVEEEGTDKKVHKMIIVKRVEVKEIIEEEMSKTTKATEPQLVELTPQVLERSLQLQDFQISPNPASEVVNLSFKGESAPTTIRVLGLDGKQLYKEFIRDFNGLYQNEIDLKGINASFLIINIEQDGKVYSEKLAVKK